MTRDEFMEEARKEIDRVLLTHKNRLMNLVMKAWSEGKKNAEYAHIDELGNDILESLKKRLPGLETPNITIPEIPLVKGPYNPDPSIVWSGDIPTACRSCPNHPSNGGSGICHCILGTEPVMCSTSASNSIKGMEVLDNSEPEISDKSET